MNDDLYRPFAPRKARRITIPAGIASVVLLPLLGAFTGESWFDYIAFTVTGIAGGWFMWRQATVKAVPDPEGVTVRNLLVTTRLTWPQVVSVRFGTGRPWAQLDLSDGDVLAVMAVQQADGELAQREARRLATLVELGSAVE